jgi:hypothetical protein
VSISITSQPILPKLAFGGYYHTKLPISTYLEGPSKYPNVRPFF